MKIVAVVVCLVAIAAPLADATLGLLTAGSVAVGLPVAAVPAAVALGGGLGAVKLLKLLGLKKLKKKLGAGAASEIYDYGDNYGSLPLPQFAPPPYHGAGQAPFYIVPAGYFEGRRKRDVQQTQETAGPALEEEEYFAVIVGSDNDSCVQRLVCALAGVAPEELSENGRIIMSLFETDSVPAYTELRSPKGPLSYAVWVGHSSKNSELTCAQHYSQCDKTPAELMQALEAETAVETTEASQGSEESEASV